MKDGTTPLEVGYENGVLKNKKEREDAESRAKAIVIATTHYNDPKVLLEVSSQAQSAMKGLAVAAIAEADMLQTRGW